MRLGFRRTLPAPPPVAAVEDVVQSSRALPHVLGRLEGAPRCGVLDLGGPVAENVALYARHRSRIAFADYHRFRARSRSGLPPAFGHVDVALAWDLFNYLALDEIGGLMDTLAARCSPGALVLALISSQGRIAEAPSRYVVRDRKTLVVAASGPAVRSSPAYSEQALLRAMPALTVESRFQLRSGMVEYLFSGR